MIAWFASSPFSLLDFPLDDAWIHRIYSAAFASGNGFEYNPGQIEAGSTSPLWSIITAPIHWFEDLGISALVIGVKLTGILLALGSVLCCVRIGDRLTGSKLPGTAAAIMLALDPRTAFSALSGMETMLLVFLWLAAVDQLSRRHYPAAAVLISLTPTARPEALVLLPFFVLALFSTLMPLRTNWKKLWVMGLMPIPMLLWSLFCRLSNGHWLPTTFYMKSTAVEIGAVQFSTGWKVLGMNGPLPSIVMATALLLLGLLVVKRAGSGIAPALMLLAAPLAFLFGVLFSRDYLTAGYYWVRWTDPAVILLTAVTGFALGGLLDRLSNKTALITAAAAAILCLPHFISASTAWRARLISDARNIHLLQVQTGKWLAENTPDDAVIGVNDAGAIRYFSQRTTIDLMGLNNADIAFGRKQPGRTPAVNYLAVTPAWFYGTGLLDGLENLAHFAVPADEYTITSNKGQREILIYSIR